MCIRDRFPTMLRTSTRVAVKASRAAKCTSFSGMVPISTRSLSSKIVSVHRGSTLRSAVSTLAYNSRFMAVRYATSIPVPPMAESLTEGSLKEYTKQVGEFVDKDELLATIETDKIDVEVISPIAGTVTKLNFQPEDTVTVGEEIAQIEPGEKPTGSAASSAPAEESKPAEPAAKKEEAAPAPAAAAPSPAPAAPKQESKPAAPKKEEAPQTASASFTNFSRNEHKVKMNRMRMRIAERLKESQNTAASLTTFNEVDMSAVLEMRKLYKDEIIKTKNVKFGFMGLFSKACTLAAKDIPCLLYTSRCV